MQPAELQLVFAYDAWATARLLDAVARLDRQTYAAATTADGGSLHAALVHTLSALRIWRNRCEGESPRQVLTAETVPDLQALRLAWAAEHQALSSMLERLSEQELNAVIGYTTTQGIPFKNVCWHMLLHLANHSTQHRSEIAEVLTGLGCSPGDLDFMLFIREHAS